MPIVNLLRPFVPAALAVATLVAPFHGAEASKGFSVLYAFCRQAACADGATPEGGLMADSAGNLYGTTYYGGADGYGTAFEIAPGGTETVLYSFCPEAQLDKPCDDGAFPQAPLMESGGSLYGTTVSGGTNKQGTVFEISSAGTETVLYSFCSQQNCADGAKPEAGVVMDNAGNLYGTTEGGGNAYCPGGCGTVFELAANGTETVLYSFCPQGTCSDGAEPGPGGLVDAGDGKTLYGTAQAGGANGFGAVFKLSGGTETVLHSFSNEDGDPSAGVIMMKGDLYGTTFGSFSQDDYGEVFKLGTAGGQAR